MSVFPFYIVAHSSSRQSPIQGGVRRKDGRMTTYLYQRDEGSITAPYTIEQFSREKDGVRKLITEVSYLGNVISTHVTDY